MSDIGEVLCEKCVIKCVWTLAMGRTDRNHTFNMYFSYNQNTEEKELDVTHSLWNKNKYY